MENYGSQDDDDDEEDDDDEDDDDEDDDDEDDDDEDDGEGDSHESGGYPHGDVGESVHYRSEMQFSEIQSQGGGGAAVGNSFNYGHAQGFSNRHQ